MSYLKAYASPDLGKMPPDSAISPLNIDWEKGAGKWRASGLSIAFICFLFHWDSESEEKYCLLGNDTLKIHPSLLQNQHFVCLLSAHAIKTQPFCI